MLGVVKTPSLKRGYREMKKRAPVCTRDKASCAIQEGFPQQQENSTCSNWWTNGILLTGH